MSIASSPYAPSPRTKPTSRKLSERSPDNPEHTKAKTAARFSGDEEGQRLVFNSAAAEDESNEDEAAPQPKKSDCVDAAVKPLPELHNDAHAVQARGWHEPVADVLARARVDHHVERRGLQANLVAAECTCTII